MRVIASGSVTVTNEVVSIAQFHFFYTSCQRPAGVFNGVIESFVICILPVASFARLGLAAGLAQRSGILVAGYAKGDSWRDQSGLSIR